ncbi:MAG: LPO_1073/Vpar_1526 family protein [Dialister sp.]|nr:LPO_1073/Vpar_1526 family protein [Dialister sp.]
MNFMPYVVLLGVALFFLLVCALLVFGWPIGSSVKRESSGPVRGRRKIKREPPRKKEIERERSAAKEVDVSAATRIISAADVAKALAQSEDMDKTQIISIGDSSKASVEAEDMEKTRIFSPGDLAEEQPEDMEKTKVFSPGETAHARTKAKSAGASPFGDEPEVQLVDDAVTPAELEEHFVRHFLNQYGAVSHMVEQDTRTVTHQLITALGVKDKEASDMLGHIMVQEALKNAQRTYVMMPDRITLGMVTDAFLDVARGHRSEIKTNLAYDALRAMPRMEMSEFNSLSLLLLFHYSRNTDNVDASALRLYGKRYVAPFLSHLPESYGGYQQMEYLRCVSLENKDTPFGQVLRDSYPLIFAFKGCMKSELESVWPSPPSGVIVPSLFSSYYKVAAVDDGLLAEALADGDLQDDEKSEKIMSLMHSRLVPYDRKELVAVLKKVSPHLADMQEIWDTSLLRRSSLTLMGMYIARLCIRETIGEDFDLSHWM